MREILEIGAAIVLSFGVSGTVIFGLSSWLGKVWASRILEQDRLRYQGELERVKNELEATAKRLQGDIDKTIFVHRLHFETEFLALRDIWQRVARVRATMALPLRQRDLNDKAHGAFEEASTAVTELIEKIDALSPFYPKDIYFELDKLRVQATGLLSAAADDTPRGLRHDYWPELKERIERISDGIRNRLEQLSLVSSAPEE